MTKKAILLTFISAIGIVILAGTLSYVVWIGQPSADTLPPTPPDPIGVPTEKPPVPPIPRLSGDILDDGIVSALDINSIIVKWKQVALDYNLVDASSDIAGTISSLDLSQTIKYWKCVEQKGETSCPYLNSSDVQESPIPTVQPSPGNTANDTVPTPTATSSSGPVLPPIPPVPAN
ncbi:MAG: hypothetical protein ABH810_04230 [bacterium]